jgi:hypothetical protein
MAEATAERGVCDPSPSGGELGLCHPTDRATQTPAVITHRPFIGVFAVLLGSVISTLDSRLTGFGIADVRGAVHAGFDEGRGSPPPSLSRR